MHYCMLRIVIETVWDTNKAYSSCYEEQKINKKVCKSAHKGKLETVSIAEPLQNRQHARNTPNAVNTRREEEWEGELKGRREEEGN